MFDHDGGMVFGGVFVWLFWLVLIVLIVVVVRAVAGGTGSNRSGIEETPLEILRKRYARGEIDEEEFNRKRRELER